MKELKPIHQMVCSLRVPFLKKLAYKKKKNKKKKRGWRQKLSSKEREKRKEKPWKNKYVKESVGYS